MESVGYIDTVHTKLQGIMSQNDVILLLTATRIWVKAKKIIIFTRTY
jgi:hypothetical protein